MCAWRNSLLRIVRWFLVIAGRRWLLAIMCMSFMGRNGLYGFVDLDLICRDCESSSKVWCCGQRFFERSWWGTNMQMTMQDSAC